MRCSAKFTTIVFFFIYSLLFLQAASSQDFYSLDSDLEQLENLIIDTLRNTEEQMILLENLKEALNESEIIIEDYGNTIGVQELLLTELRVQLNEMSEIYRMQSSLSAKYERSSRFWRTFTLIAIPVTAFISGGIVSMIN